MTWTLILLGVLVALWALAVTGAAWVILGMVARRIIRRDLGPEE